MHITKVVEIYYAVDEFLIKCVPSMEKRLLLPSRSKPTRICSLTLSEIITILMASHGMGFSNFKAYYIHLQQFHSSEFGKLYSFRVGGMD